MGKGSPRKGHFPRLKLEEEQRKTQEQGPWGCGGRGRQGVRATVSQERNGEERPEGPQGHPEPTRETQTTLRPRAAHRPGCRMGQR